MTMTSTMTHAADCIHEGAYQEADQCECIDGRWNQPERFYVDEAKSQLYDDAPWCRIRELAEQLRAQAGE